MSSVSGRASEIRVSLGNRSPHKRRSLNPGGTLKQPADPGGMVRQSRDVGGNVRPSRDRGGVTRRSLEPAGSLLKTFSTLPDPMRRSADLEIRSCDPARRSPDSRGGSHDPGWLLRKPLDSRSPSVNSVDLANSSIQPSCDNAASVQGEVELEHAQSNGCGNHDNKEVTEEQGAKETAEVSGGVGEREKSGKAMADRKYTRRSLRKRKPVKALFSLAASSDSNMDSADDLEHVHNSHPDVAPMETHSKEAAAAALSSNSGTPSSSASSLTVGVALDMVEGVGGSGEYKSAGDVPVVQKRGRGRPRKYPISEVVSAKSADHKRVQRLKRLGIRSKRKFDLTTAAKGRGFLSTSQTSESSESEMERKTRKRGRPSHASMLSTSDSGSNNKKEGDIAPKTKRLCGSSSSSASSPASKKGPKPGVFLGTMLAPLLAEIGDLDIFLPLDYKPYQERIVNKQSGDDEFQTEPTNTTAEHPEHTSSAIFNHPLEKLISADSHTSPSNSSNINSDHLPLSRNKLSEESTSSSQSKPVPTKRINLRNTADRRSRANCSSNYSTPTSTPLMLSPKSAEGDDHLPDDIPVSNGADLKRNNLDECSSPNVDPKDGNRKSRRFGSKSKATGGSSGGSVASGSNKQSQHFKFLNSLESDYGRGSNSTRGSMLYAHENFPEKLATDEPWIDRARTIWSLWRTKVPGDVRNEYIERAKQNKKNLADASSVPSPDRQVANQMRKNTARKLSAFTPMTSRLKEASPLQFDSLANATTTSNKAHSSGTCASPDTVAEVTAECRSQRESSANGNGLDNFDDNSSISNETGSNTASISLASASSDSLRQTFLQIEHTEEVSTCHHGGAFQQPLLPHFSAANVGGAGDKSSKPTTCNSHTRSTGECGGKGRVDAMEFGNSSRDSEMYKGSSKVDSSSKKEIIAASGGGMGSFGRPSPSQLEASKENSSTISRDQHPPRCGQPQMTRKQRSCSVGAAEHRDDYVEASGVACRQQAKLQLDPHLALCGRGLSDNGRPGVFNQSMELPGWPALSEEPIEALRRQANQSKDSLEATGIGKRKSETALSEESVKSSMKPAELGKGSNFPGKGSNFPGKEMDLLSEKVNTRSISSVSPRKGGKAGQKAKQSGKLKALLESPKKAKKLGQEFAMLGQLGMQEPSLNERALASNEKRVGSVNGVMHECASMDGKGFSKLKHDNKNRKLNSSIRAGELCHKMSKLEEIANQLRKQSNPEETQLLERMREEKGASKEAATDQSQLNRQAASGVNWQQNDLIKRQQDDLIKPCINNTSYSAVSISSATDNYSTEQVFEGDDLEPVFFNGGLGGDDPSDYQQVLTVETAKVLCDTSPIINQESAAITIKKQKNMRSRYNVHSSSCSTPTSDTASLCDAFGTAVVDPSNQSACEADSKRSIVPIKIPEVATNFYPMMRVGESTREDSSPVWLAQFCVSIERVFNPIYAPQKEVNAYATSPGVLPSNDPISPSPSSRTDQSFNSAGLADGSCTVPGPAGCNSRNSSSSSGSRRSAFQYGPSVPPSEDYRRPVASPSWAGPGYTSPHPNQNGRHPVFPSQPWHPHSENAHHYHMGHHKERQTGEKHAKSKSSKKHAQGKHAKKASNNAGRPAGDWPASNGQNYSITTQNYSFASPGPWRHSPSPLASSLSSCRPRSQSASHHQGTRSLPQTPTQLPPQAESLLGIDKGSMATSRPARNERSTSTHTFSYGMPEAPLSTASSLDVHFPSSLRETCRTMHNTNSTTNPIRMYDDNIVEEGISPASAPVTPHWEYNSGGGGGGANHEGNSRQPNKAVSIVSPVQTAENKYPGQPSPRQSLSHPSQSGSMRSAPHFSRSISNPSRPSSAIPSSARPSSARPSSARPSSANPQAPNTPTTSVPTLPSNHSRLPSSSLWNQPPTNPRPTSMPLNISSHVDSDASPDPRAGEQEIFYFQNRYRKNSNQSEDSSVLPRQNHSLLQQEAVTPDAARNHGDSVSLQEHCDDVFSPPGSSGRESWYSSNSLAANQEHNSENYRLVPSSRGRDLSSNNTGGRTDPAYVNGRLSNFGRSRSFHGTSVSSEDMCSGDSPDSGHVTPERQRQYSFADSHVLQYSGNSATAFAPSRGGSNGGGKKSVSKRPPHPSMQQAHGGRPSVSSGSNNSFLPIVSSASNHKGHQVRNPSFPGAVRSVNSPVNSQRPPSAVSSSSANSSVAARRSVSSTTPQPPLVFHQFYRSSTTSSTTRFSQTFHGHGHETPAPPRPSSRELHAQLQNPTNEADLMSMNRPELEQFRYYLMEYLKHSNALLQRVEERLGVLAGGVCPPPLTQEEVGKRLMALTMEPDCAIFDNDQPYRQKFGYSPSREAPSDLIVGGTPESPIINPKYDIYGQDVRRGVSP